MKPMKYASVGSAEILHELLDSPQWSVEQKMDGTRGWALLRGDEPAVMTVGVTRDGQPMPLKHTAATQHLRRIFTQGVYALHERLMPGESLILDGEIMIDTGEFRVFDVPLLSTRNGANCSPDTPQQKRRELLEQLATGFGSAASLVPQAIGGFDKRWMLTNCRRNNVEGVVFKHLDAPYRTDGKRTDRVLKYKFVKTADVIVIRESRSRNSEGREVGSIAFGVTAGPEAGWDGIEIVEYDNGQQAGVKEIGTCSVIGKPHVEPGDVIEVAYLYRAATGGLIQPRMTRIRHDKSPRECGIDQFVSYSREIVR